MINVSQTQRKIFPKPYLHVVRRNLILTAMQRSKACVTRLELYDNSKECRAAWRHAKILGEDW
jgi:hypothetical protein